MTCSAVVRVYDIVAGWRVYTGELLHALVVIADSVGDEDGRFKIDEDRIAWYLAVDVDRASELVRQLKKDSAIVPDKLPWGEPCWRINWERLRDLGYQRRAAQGASA